MTTDENRYLSMPVFLFPHYYSTKAKQHKDMFQLKIGEWYISNAYCLLAKQIECFRQLKTTVCYSYFHVRYLSVESQISVNSVLDICQFCFRYLSVEFQISVSSVSDICQFFPAFTRHFLVILAASADIFLLCLLNSQTQVNNSY